MSNRENPIAQEAEDLPTGEIQNDMAGQKLWMYIDAENPDHPLEKKALLRGIPVKVKA
jgi:hypothetical protein